MKQVLTITAVVLLLSGCSKPNPPSTSNNPVMHAKSITLADPYGQITMDFNYDSYGSLISGESNSGLIETGEFNICTY